MSPARYFCFPRFASYTSSLLESSAIAAVAAAGSATIPFELQNEGQREYFITMDIPPKTGGRLNRPVRRTEAPWRRRPHHPGDRLRLSADPVCSCFGPATAKTVQKPCKGRRITEGLPQENRGHRSHRFPSLERRLFGSTGA
jgi:hypothetical protein